MSNVPYKFENLIVLVYDRVLKIDVINIVQAVREFAEEGFAINLENGTWDYRIFQQIPIGESRYYFRQVDSSKGVIGVYDRTREDHQRNLKRNKKVALINAKHLRRLEEIE